MAICLHSSLFEAFFMPLHIHDFNLIVKRVRPLFGFVLHLGFHTR